MKKTLKKLLTGFLVLTSFFVSACAAPAENPEDDTDTDSIQWNEENENKVETKGIATNLTLSIGGGENAVWAKVKNNFTLLPSTIWVYVELYSSETYRESYTAMKLEKTDSVKDLNIGKSITISAPTNGEQKYWQARMRYKFDDRDWVSKTTSTFLYSAEGEVMDEHEEEIKQPTAQGSFYSLQEAYDNELLTQEDLQAIADYHNNGEVCTYTLNDATAQLIKESAAYYERTAEKNPVLGAKAEDYEILKYYGSYNGCYAVILNTPYSGHLGIIVDEWITIGGVDIHYRDFYNISIWKQVQKPAAKGPFYSLQQAYDNGWLTRENLQSISDYRTNINLQLPELSEDIAQKVKEDWVNNYKEQNNITEEFTATIHDYYGTYNDYIVVVIDRTDAMYPDIYAPIDIEIGGVKFTFQLYAPQLYVYKLGQPEIPNKEILSLEQAYKCNLLSKEDLKSIADYYNNPDTRPNNLNETTRETIRTAFCKQFGITNYDNVGIPSTYYGTYNNCMVIEISTTCEIGGDPVYYPEYIIGGVTFYRYCPLTVYRKI